MRSSRGPAAGVSMVIALLVLAGLACGIDVSTAHLQDAAIYTDGTYGTKARSYDPADTFYAQAQLAEAGADTPVKVVWHALGGEDGTPDRVIYEEEQRGSSGTYRFEAPPPDPAWLVGEYRVDFYVLNRKRQSITFPVNNPALIRNGRMALDPLGDTTTSVYATTDTFYAVLDLANAPANTALVATWVAADAAGYEPDTALDSASLQVESGTLVLEQPAPDGGWPLGRYRLDVTLNGEGRPSVRFEVIAPTVSSARTVASATDATRVRSYATTDPFYAQITLEAAPPDTVLDAAWIAADAAGYEPDSVLDSQTRTGGTGTLVFELAPPDGAWPLGAYRLDLALDGTPIEPLSFQVTPPGIRRVRLATDRSAAETVEGYGPRDAFYAIIDLGTAPPGTEVTAIWRAIDQRGETVNARLGEDTITSRTGTLIFELPLQAEAWPWGTYELALLVNGETAETVPFAVTSPATITRATLTTDPDGLTESASYAPDATVYVVVVLADAPGDTLLRAEGVAADSPEQTPPLGSADLTAGSGTHTLALAPPDGGWPPGEVVVRLVLNGTGAGELRFSVSG